jgi:hypothetical protein
MDHFLMKSQSIKLNTFKMNKSMIKKIRSIMSNRSTTLELTAPGNYMRI